MTDDLAPVTSGRDWYAWHDSYEDGDSTLARRLTVVQGWLRQALDQLPAGPVRLISMVAGQARDVEGALRDHPRAGDVSGRIVELDQRNSDVARKTLSRIAGDRIEVVTGDASQADAYLGATPAEILVVVGLFGNIAEADIERTIGLLPGFAAPGAYVVWSRGGARQGITDLNPTVRQWFAQAGFTELEHTYIDGHQGLGFNRFDGTPAPFPAGAKLFEFVGWEQANR
ncbi:MAG: SAM-dependent methyltransferase [Streptosporangiaceae bacterium]|jgi:hypothetical protein